MQEVTEFQVLQFKNQLEYQIECHGQHHKESLRFLLQYCKMLGQYASQQDVFKGLHIYEQCYKLLVDPSKLLVIQNPYWRLLIMVGIKLSQAHFKANEPQQSLNILIQIENQVKKSARITAEWSYNVQLECLYFHLAFAWKRVGNCERAQHTANECIMLIKQNLKMAFKEKEVYMAVEILQLLATFKYHDLHGQLDYYNQMNTMCTQYLGINHKLSIKASMKINQLKSQIVFESEIEQIAEFSRPPHAQTQVGFYEDESQELFKDLKSTRRQLTASERQLQTIKSSVLSKATSKGESKSRKNSSQRKLVANRKSAEELRKFTDIMLSPTTKTPSSGENKFFYWINAKKLNMRTKTETTNWKTQNSKEHQSHFRKITSPKTDQSMNLSFLMEIPKTPIAPENPTSLMLQRPKTTACFQRISKQIAIKSETYQVTPNRDFHLKKGHAIKEKVFKFPFKKEVSRREINILPPDLSEQKSEKPAQDTFVETHQRQGSLDLGQLEKEYNAAVVIQRFYRWKKLRQRMAKRRKTIVATHGNESEEDHDTSEYLNSMVMSLRFKSKGSVTQYKRSSTFQIDQPLFRTVHVPSSTRGIQIPAKVKGKEGPESHREITHENTQINEEEQISELSIDLRSKRILKLFSLDLKEQVIIYCKNFIGLLKLYKIEMFVLSKNLAEFNIEVMQLKLFFHLNNRVQVLIVEIDYSIFETKLRKTKQDYLQLTIDFLCQYLKKNYPDAKSSEVLTIIISQTAINPEQYTRLTQLLSQLITNSSIQKAGITSRFRPSQNKNVNKIKDHYKKQQKNMKAFLAKIFPLQMRSLKNCISISDRQLSIEIPNTPTQNKFKRAKNAVLFTVKTKQQLNKHPLQPPAIPLMLIEDSEDTPKSLELSGFRDQEINRFSLKSVIGQTNGNQNKHHKKVQSNQLSDNMWLNKSINNQRKTGSPMEKAKIFKKTQTVEQPQSFQEKIKQTTKHTAGLSSEEEHEQGSVEIQQAASKENLIEKRIDLIDLDSEQDSRVTKIQTIYQKGQHFTVSPNWKKRKTPIAYNKTFSILTEPKKTSGFKQQNLYLNPFETSEVLFRSTMKLDGTYFIVIIKQVLNEKCEYFNANFINKSNSTSILVNYRVSKPMSVGWDYEKSFKFREFMKWFVPDFSLVNYVKNLGLTNQQKINLSNNLQKYITIYESKIKVQYYQQHLQKMQKKLPKSRKSYLAHLQACNLKPAAQNNYYQEDALNQHGFQENKMIHGRFSRIHDFQVTIPLPKYVEIDFYHEVVNKTLNVPNELKSALLQNFNTLRTYKKNYFTMRLKQQYFLWNNQYAYVWQPFKKQTWLKAFFVDVETLINAIQSQNPMQAYLLRDKIRPTKFLTGSKILLKPQERSYRPMDEQSLNLWKWYFGQGTDEVGDLYKFLTELKCSLVSKAIDCDFWKRYFKQHNHITHVKVKGLGQCLVELKIFDSTQHQFYVYIKLFQFKNMRTTEHKIVMTSVDLSIMSGIQYHEFSYSVFDDIRRVLQRQVIYRRSGIQKQVKLNFTNLRTNTNVNLVCKFPWLQRFNYDQPSPYFGTNGFFHQDNNELFLICHCCKVLTIPKSTAQSEETGFRTYGQQTGSVPADLKVPCIITIEKSQKLQIFFIKIYFPSNQRKLLTQVNFSDLNLKQLSFQFKDQLRKENSQKIWLQLIDTFKIQFSPQNKIVLSIEKLSINCILQEVLHYESKLTIQENSQILFLIYIENKTSKQKDEVEIINRFPKLKIDDTKSYSLFLKFFWIQQPIKMQSFRLPLQQLLLGFIKSQKLSDTTFDFAFKLSDLIHLSKACIENIILNFATHTYNNSLQYIIPKEVIGQNENKIKLNISLPGVSLQKSEYKLIYRGVLMKRQPQILVGIYNKQRKRMVYFFLQNLNDCKDYVHKLPYEFIENILPGFSQTIHLSPGRVGLQLFQAFKNQLILKSFYNLS